MKKENKNVVVVSCPPCGENVALATKRGAYKAISLMSPSIGPADHFLRKGGRLAFTLIELLVVVLIIGILAAVAVPQYQKAVVKSRAMESLTLLRAVVPAVREYILANGKFPSSFDDLSVVPSGELGTYAVEHDQVISGKSKIILVNGRLNAAFETESDLIPGFIYPTEFYTGLVDLEPNHIYCYHMNGEEKKKQICASLGTMVKNNGEDTRFFRID